MAAARSYLEQGFTSWADIQIYLLRATLMLPWMWAQRGQWQTEYKRDIKPALMVGLLFPLAYLMALIAMRYAPVSYVAPARELSMLIGAFLGVKLLGERASWQRVAGTICLLFGVFGLVI